MSDRLQALHTWLQSVINTDQYEFAPASADASFRRYFRVGFDNQTLIVMDAPPEHENSDKFIRIAQMLAGFGLNVPIIKADDLDQGFLLITDLGNRTYLSELNENNVDQLYGDAMDALIMLQGAGTDHDLPPYDHALLMRELEILREWLLQKHLELTLDDGTNSAIDECFEFLAASALEQPKVVVHRDYHSRNLQITDSQNPGILDFQDAVIGPVTYDLVSLLRDCYIAWPQERVLGWARSHHERCQQSGILSNEIGVEQFVRWLDLMGIQRHIKAAGIFARLNHRDGKPGYLNDIPRTLGYVLQVGSQYPELAPLLKLLKSIDLEQVATA